MKCTSKAITVVVLSMFLVWMVRTTWTTADALVQLVRLFDYPNGKSDMILLFLTYTGLCVVGTLLTIALLFRETRQLLELASPTNKTDKIGLY